MSTIIEELSEQHELAYKDYNDAYKEGESNRFYELFDPLFSFGNVDVYKFNQVIEWYKRKRNIDMNVECNKQDKILNTSRIGDLKYVRDYQTAHRIYILRNKIDDKILGVIDIHCYNDEYLRKVVPEIAYEVRPDERGKGYGLLQLKLMLESNDVNVEKFNVRIASSNTASLSLLRHFNGFKTGETIDRYLGTIEHFQLDNPTYQKRIH